VAQERGNEKVQVPLMFSSKTWVSWPISFLEYNSNPSWLQQRLHWLLWSSWSHHWCYYLL
jgi:hypothetical protein